MSRLAEAQLAVMMLTRLPAGRLETAPSIGASVWAFPLVGMVVGGIAAAVLIASLAAGVAPALAAGLALVAGVLTTGGLHEDGLADVADGFGGGRDRARKLEIMRDSRIGSYGGIALILSLGLRWQGLALLAEKDPCLAALALVALAAASRSGLAAMLLLMPAARADGMGKAAAQTSFPVVLVSLGFGVLALAVLGTIGVWAALAIAAVQIGFGLIAQRQIGGQSGDVLGAAQQLAEIAGWIVLSTMV